MTMKERQDVELGETSMKAENEIQDFRLAEPMVSDRHFTKRTVRADVAVIGAGPAGLCAAVSAARAGRTVVLVTDRPVLGGSASSEIRVGPGGADYACWNRDAKETGIFEEIFNNVVYRAQKAGKWRWFQFDDTYFDLVFSEKKIKVELNTYISRVEKSNDRITAVEGCQSRAETVLRVEAKVFVDASGDGTIGWLAGCPCRMGMESVAEFGERFGPQQARPGTMGSTLLFTSVDTGHRVPFECPDWAVRIEQLGSFGRIQRSISTMPDGSYYGFWWVEYGGTLDMIRDDNEIIQHLRKLIYGIWDFVKNSGRYPESENQELNWIGYLPGKRESRRIMGDYVVNSRDLFSQRVFEDSVCYTGWPVDVHEPEGYASTGDGYTHHWLRGIASLPARCLVAAGVSNLLLAGRDVSCTREALGSMRLISTTAGMGQAAGMMAAMAAESGTDIRTVLAKRYPELRARLLKADQSIVGAALLLKNDLAKRAKLTVGSTHSGNADRAETSCVLGNHKGLILPCETLADLELYLSADGETEVEIECYSADPRPENYRPDRKIFHAALKVSESGWYCVNPEHPLACGGKVFVLVRKNERARIWMMKEHFCGVTSFETGSDEFSETTPFHVVDHETSVPLTFCYRHGEARSYFKSDTLQDGMIRPYGFPHMWMSGEMRPDGEDLLFEFGREAEIREIELVFNSDLNSKRLKPVINRAAPELVKRFRIYGRRDGVEELLICEKNNFLRLFSKKVSAVCDAVRVVIDGTWGSRFAQIFDLRILEAESGRE